MVANSDIFDYTATHLLVRKGKILSPDALEAIFRINAEKNTIYVSEETYNMMLRRSLGQTVQVRADLESGTGYTEIKNEALTFLHEIEETGAPLSQETLTKVSAKLSEQLETTKADVILDLVNALAPVDEYLQRHCINVSLLNGLMGKWLKVPKEIVDTLVLVGLLHDCGKAQLPRQIISAPRPLTAVEFEVIKMHTVYSYDMLSEFPENVRMGACSHHEKINGEGYPHRLAGQNIPMLGRITAIGDIYDALTARRSYKEPKSPFFAMSLLKKLAGKELDTMLVNVFLENMPGELIDKPVKLSNGDIATIHSVDLDDIEYPRVKVRNKTIKCTKELYCLCMFMEETD
jgi:HD-GYP domain-containing protein (c-di-GMP phosphodiesterase class II)